MQPADAGDPLRQPGPAYPPSRLVLDLDVVVILGPVVPDEQHLIASRRVRQQTTSPAAREDLRKLMIKCSRLRRARHPISGPASRPPAGARSVNRTATRPATGSAHPPAATGPESAAANPVNLISNRRRVAGLPGTADFLTFGAAEPASDLPPARSPQEVDIAPVDAVPAVEPV